MVRQSYDTEDFLRRLVQAWVNKIRKGVEYRKPFDDVRDQCMTFVAGAAGEAWDPMFQRKFLGKELNPKFSISLNKAFEVVAIFGPVLYNRNPVRTVYPNETIDLEAEAFGDPNDPQIQAYYGQLAAMQAQEAARNRIRCQLMESYLNYTPVEQPQGLRLHAEDAVTEGLVTGRGILWPESYKMPSSGRTLTGCFHGSVWDLVTDPDARRIDFGNTKWIARRHMDPIWEVERRFGLPRGSLKGQIESAGAQSERVVHDTGNLERERGHTFDLLEWWELWSIGGVGSRLAGMDPTFRGAFDETVGDYAYLAIAANVPWPLNCPHDKFVAAYPEEIRQRFSWPTPFWLDRRWPCALLDFYRHPRRSWPIAVLAPGLGELMFLNFLFSRTANHIWESTKMFIGAPEDAKKNIEDIIKRGEDLAVFGIEDIHENVDKMISFLQMPNVSTDVWSIATTVMELFDKRIGLTEIWYALHAGGAASRTATDVQAKTEKAAIRPDYMAHQVEEFMSEAARMESLCAYWQGVSGRDVRPLLGGVAANLWDPMIADADPEEVAREMRATVVAGSAKKRNRQNELASLERFYAPMNQSRIAYAQLTGDSAPLNALDEKVFDTLDYDGSGLEMGPWAPPPPPPGTGPEAEAAMEQEAHDAELARKEEGHDQELRHDEEQHDLEMELRQEEGEQKLELEDRKAQLQARLIRMRGTQAKKTSGNGKAA